jgi:hypothetical protein
METNKAVKIGTQKQDVADLSLVGSKECPQGEALEANIVIVSFHARYKPASAHRENKQQITEGVDVGAATTTIIANFLVIFVLFMLFAAVAQHHNTIHTIYVATCNLKL